MSPSPKADSAGRAIAAVDRTAARIGIDAAGAAVIKDSNNTIVLLPVERLVAKVSTSVLPGRDRTALERELRIGVHVAAKGAKIAPPADPDVAGPHRIGDAVLTFWRYQQPQPPPSNQADLGRVVRSFHSALAELAVALPRLADKIDHAAELFGDRGRTPWLTDRDRRLAAQAEPRIHELLDRLNPNTALHGAPHDGNVIWTIRGPLLIDFEESCTGPLEWDLAYLPDESRGAFPDRDNALVERLRAVVSYCVAAWCWAQPERAPEVDAAAKHHLALLGRSWLAARSWRTP
jgi:hypothetical protein